LYRWRLEKDSKLLRWIRDVKKCKPKSLEGIFASQLLQSRLEAEAEAERQKEEKEEAKKHRAAQKRKETMMKRKREQDGEAEHSGESEESTGEECLRISTSHEEPDSKVEKKRLKTEKAKENKYGQ
jgi:hypothetical protein